MKGYLVTKYLDNVTKEMSSIYSAELPEPNCNANDVLVDVKCAGTNFFDILQMQGKHQSRPQFPWIPGTEFSGVISKASPLPKGCPFEPGTKVFGAAQGAYAERVAADWRGLIEIPEGISFEQASGLYITYPTSYAAMTMRANLQKGEWCLVHAGAGGVGLSCIQIAKALGAKVIATAGSDGKLQICRKIGGADELINYNQKDWHKKVLEITNGKGVDVVYDPVGLLLPSIKCIAWNGRLVVVGFAAGSIEKVPANLILLRNISVVGVHWGEYRKRQPEAVPPIWEALLELMRQGRLRPAVFDHSYSGLESVPEALRALANRETWGKAVVTIEDGGGREGKGRHSKL